MKTPIWDLIGYRIYKGWGINNIPNEVWDYVMEAIAEDVEGVTV